MIRFNKESVPFEQTGFFENIVTDYLIGKSELKDFYTYTPEYSTFEKIISDRKKYAVDRTLLIDVLNKQYNELKKDPGFGIDPEVLMNIQSLDSENSFTVTTGHQLNIFTGPLYFLYKIITTIRLAEELRRKFPANNFVPVYWMASEDHDMDEIRFVHLPGQQLEWKTSWTGPSGRASCAGLTTVIDELEKLIGHDTVGNKLILDFRKCYDESISLSLATRRLVNQWFGKDGLVILDPDDKRLKKKMIPVFRDEMQNQTSFQLVKKSTENLAGKYKIQVNPREINLFSLVDNRRERIVPEQGAFSVLNTGTKISTAEMETKLEVQPETFSPNVILRPVFQETILPNLAMIGGPAEIAYWLEYKQLFEKWNVFFPMLLLRQCILLVDSRQQEKMLKYGINSSGLFESSDTWIRHFLLHSDGQAPDLSSIIARLGIELKQIEAIAEATDSTLKASAEAESKRILSQLQNFNDKLIRNYKKKNEDTINQLKKLKESLFPDGGLQERKTSVISAFLRFGPDFIQQLKDALDPMDLRFHILFEKKD